MDFDPRELLNLYSLRKIRDHFEAGGRSAEEVIEETLEVASEDDVIDFAAQFHSTTHNHLYLFPCADAPSAPPLGDSGLLRTWSDGGTRSAFYVRDLSYRVVLNDPLELVEVTTPWPILIRWKSGVLFARFTIMKQRAGSLVDSEERDVVRARKEVKERDLVRDLRELLELSPSGLDLNRGVKALWEADLIDAEEATFKRPRSTTKESMDGEYTLKSIDPDAYARAMAGPLLKTAFRWIGPDRPSFSFAVDATRGTVFFTRYSDLGSDSDYVAEEILRRN